jgi:Protein of unknown function (DUF2695)
MKGRETMTDEVMTFESPRWDEFTKALCQELEKWGCHHGHHLAEAVMTKMGNIDLEASIDYFEEHGGYCDCEIIMNVDWNEQIRKEKEAERPGAGSLN